MALTVAEAVKELSRLTQEREIWMDVVEYLSRCVGEETPGGKAQVFITIRESGNKVPQDMVKQFIDRINEKEIEPLNQLIEELEGLNVYEETNDDGTGTEAKAENDTPPARPTVGKVGKSVLAVPKYPRPKAQSSG